MVFSFNSISLIFYGKFDFIFYPDNMALEYGLPQGCAELRREIAKRMFGHAKTSPLIKL